MSRSAGYATEHDGKIVVARYRFYCGRFLCVDRCLLAYHRDMGFLRRLRGPDQRSAPLDAMGHVTFLATGLAETGDGFLWDGVATSPNDRFVLLTRDAPDDDVTAGARGSGHGRYRLVEKRAGLRRDGRLERPNDGHVADNGTFIVADWLFTDQLRGRLHVFDAHGNEIIRRECQANILTTYVEPEGRYAAAHLASNPDNEVDDERFILFDVARRSEVWSKQLEIGRPDELEFDVPGAALWLTNPMSGRVRYGLADGLIDVAQLRERALDNADGFTILSLVEDEIATGVSPDRRETLVAACLRAADRLGEPFTNGFRCGVVANSLHAALQSSDQSIGPSPMEPSRSRRCLSSFHRARG